MQNQKPTKRSAQLIRNFPDVVLNLVFSHLVSPRDLYFSTACTCKVWNKIVNKFMPHRKKRWHTPDSSKSLQLIAYLSFTQSEELGFPGYQGKKNHLRKHF